MPLYRVLHGEFESAVQMNSNIIKISIFTDFLKKNDFLEKFDFSKNPFFGKIGKK